MTRTLAAVPSLRAVVRGTGRSTTRRALLALSAVLLLATVAVFATSLAVFTRTHYTADTVRARTTPAIEGILAARAALVHADRAAVDGVGNGAALTGVGEDFQVQVAIASQSLTRVAGDNMAGPEGSRGLQLIEGLLVTYTGLMWQADAHLRQAGGVLGIANLLSASRLLHKEESGILAQLDRLRAAQQRALDDQLAASDMTAGTVVILVLPIVVLGVGLVVAHVFFRVRFRRRVNPALVVAAVLLAALTWVATRPMYAQQHLAESRDVLYGLVAEEGTRLATHDREGQWALRNLLVDNGCGGVAGECGATVENFFETTTEPAAAADPRGEAELARDTQAVADRNNVANANAGLAFLIYVLAILIAAAIVVAFRPRLHEYRYRPR